MVLYDGQVFFSILRHIKMGILVQTHITKIGEEPNRHNFLSSIHLIHDIINSLCLPINGESQ